VKKAAEHLSGSAQEATEPNFTVPRTSGEAGLKEARKKADRPRRAHARATRA